jgi:VCBS repeat-containing protein
MAEQSIGKVVIVYGTVKAQSTDGVERVLGPNSPIFLNDRINTGPDGAVSIVFSDPGNTQLDLGRMTDMVIDTSVIGSEAIDLEEVTAEVEAIQQALESGEELDIAETAAGPTAGGAGQGGGGRPIYRDELDGKIGEVDSGAETEGVPITFTGTTLDPVADPEVPLVSSPPPPEPAPEPMVLEEEPEPTPPPTTPPPTTPPPEQEPPIAEADTHWVQEDESVTAEGNVLVTQAHPGDPSPTVDFGDVADTDADGDTLTVSAIAFGATTGTVGGAALAGTYGELSIASNGVYTYTLDNENEAVQGLDDGETLTEVYTYTVSDGDATDTATLTITIFGSNDGPVAEADTNWAQEDGPDASGNVLQDLTHAGAPSGTFADVADTDDDGDTLTVTAVVFHGADGVLGGGDDTAGTVGTPLVSTYGTLTLNGDGSYDYLVDDSNEDVQGLDDGETLTEQYTYTVSDGDATDTATLTITIFGANDEPEAAADTHWTKEDYSLTAVGNVLVDNDNTGIAPSGTFADVADTDEDGDTLTVTAVVFHGADGVLGGGDDTAGTVGSDLTSTYGTLNISSTGDYTYTLDNDNPTVQALTWGQKLTEQYTYTVSDGDATDTATLTITIFGRGDAPTLTVDSGVVSEAGLTEGTMEGTTDPDFDIYDSGQITYDDVDATDSLNLIVGGSDLGVLDGNAGTNLGTVSETLSRTFRKLSDEGVILVQGKNIQILDIERLLDLADSYKEL